MARIFNIVAYRSLLEENEVAVVLGEKNKELDNLIMFCSQTGYKTCASYLMNARLDMFTALEKHLDGKASSLAERVMRTVNMRINVGKWISVEALNAMNVCLAHYYMI